MLTKLIYITVLLMDIWESLEVKKEQIKFGGLLSEVKLL
jgi:hypothetical protein